MDHVSAIATHANLRHLYGVGGATYYVHADMAAHVRDLFRVSEAMCGMELPATVRPFQAHGACPPCGQCPTPAGRSSPTCLGSLLACTALRAHTRHTEEIPLGNDLFVTPIPSRHRVTSHAIAVWRTVRKLKPELQGVAGDDIARRKRVRPCVGDVDRCVGTTRRTKRTRATGPPAAHQSTFVVVCRGRWTKTQAGEEVTTQERRLEVLFTGDTTIDLFDEQPVCYTAKVPPCSG